MLSVDGALMITNPELSDITTPNNTKVCQKSKESEIFNEKMESGNTEVEFLSGVRRTLGKRCLSAFYIRPKWKV